MSSKNIKNLTITVDQAANRMVASNMCQCAHYFNTESTADPSTDNNPTTVKSVSPDSCTYGTHYPNRIFVGHLPGKANASDLADFFREFGTVLEGKVVLDNYGRSRRFGFVTFSSQEDVQNVLSKIPFFFKGKKINVGPAVKRMFGAEVASDDKAEESSDDEEKIVTIPPINEAKDPSSPSTPKSGNVWMKIHAKPKILQQPKKVVDTQVVPPQQFVYPTIPYQTAPQPAQQPHARQPPLPQQPQQQYISGGYYIPVQTTVPYQQAGYYSTLLPNYYYDDYGQTVMMMSPPPPPQYLSCC